MLLVDDRDGEVGGGGAPGAPDEAARARTAFPLGPLPTLGSRGLRRAAVGPGSASRRRRGLVASLGNVSQQIPRAIGPAIAGLMFDADMFVLPFLIAAGFQLAFLFAYDRSFRANDPVTATLKNYGAD